MRRPRNTEQFREFRVVEQLARSERAIAQGHPQGDLGVALLFPGEYPVAIASLAFHRLFELCNAVEGVRCERFFYHPSFSRYFSLDSFRPLDEFEIWAFSLSFELDAYNILALLDAKGIPRLANQRTFRHPLLLLGGAVTYFNALPLEPYMDVVYHGDAEVHLASMLRIALEEFRTSGSRERLLERWASIPALSIPPLSHRFQQLAVDLQMLQNPSYSHFVSPRGEFGNKGLLEIGRGCLHRCAFCVAGHTRNPARFPKVEKLWERIALFREKGVRGVGLIAATPTDHPEMESLLGKMQEQDIPFSLSSLRLDRLTPTLLAGLRRSGQNSITIAPEGGSQKMRDVFHKGIETSDIHRALQAIADHGFQAVKMYFIYGLDEENEEDLAGFAQIGQQAQELGIQKVSMSFNPLIPKPQTPFSLRKMQDAKLLAEKKRWIEQSLRGIARTKFESLRSAQLQYALANGDENVLQDHPPHFSQR